MKWFLFLMSFNCFADCSSIASPGSIKFDQCVGDEVISDIMNVKKSLTIDQRKALIVQVVPIYLALKAGWKDVAASYINGLPVDGTIVVQERVDAIKEKLK